MDQKINHARPRKKLRIQTNGKRYQLSDSPFYKLSSKKKLAQILKVEPGDLKGLLDDDLYHVFLDSAGSKPREIEQPSKRLDKVHTRIASLLCRIDAPKYLHSGIKKRTYITNASQHLGWYPLLTTDIKSFFQSTSEAMVKSFFIKELKCSSDVAFILARIATVRGHVPTGSRLSMPIAFWANFRLFDSLHHYCVDSDIVMTVYVDDLCFSGRTVNGKTLSFVKRKVESFGHELHLRKTKLYKAEQPKLVTGVVILGYRFLVANGKLRDIYQDTVQWILAGSNYYPQSLYDRLLGRMSAQGQIDFRFKDKAKWLSKMANGKSNAV